MNLSQVYVSNRIRMSYTKPSIEELLHYELYEKQDIFKTFAFHMHLAGRGMVFMSSFKTKRDEIRHFWDKIKEDHGHRILRYVELQIEDMFVVRLHFAPIFSLVPQEYDMIEYTIHKQHDRNTLFIMEELRRLAGVTGNPEIDFDWGGLR